MAAMDHTVALDIPAHPDYVVLCRLALAGLLRDRGFSDDAVDDLKLALTEACSNSIRHAYPPTGDECGTVHVRFALDDRRIQLVVHDEGAGFLEDAVLDAGFPEGEPSLSEGGMGMAIIRAVVDEFLLEQPPEGGTRLTLTKLCDA
jgi:serine/threonine-protein kinase RsbW